MVMVKWYEAQEVVVVVVGGGGMQKAALHSSDTESCLKLNQNRVSSLFQH